MCSGTSIWISWRNVVFLCVKWSFHFLEPVRHPDLLFCGHFHWFCLVHLCGKNWYISSVDGRLRRHEGGQEGNPSCYFMRDSTILFTYTDWPFDWIFYKRVCTLLTGCQELQYPRARLVSFSKLSSIFSSQLSVFSLSFQSLVNGFNNANSDGFQNLKTIETSWGPCLRNIEQLNNCNFPSILSCIFFISLKKYLATT